MFSAIKCETDSHATSKIVSRTHSECTVHNLDGISPPATKQPYRSRHLLDRNGEMDPAATPLDQPTKSLSKYSPQLKRCCASGSTRGHRLELAHGNFNMDTTYVAPRSTVLTCAVSKRSANSSAEGLRSAVLQEKRKNQAVGYACDQANSRARDPGSLAARQS